MSGEDELVVNPGESRGKAKPLRNRLEALFAFLGLQETGFGPVGVVSQIQAQDAGFDGESDLFQVGDVELDKLRGGVGAKTLAKQLGLTGADDKFTIAQDAT